jgi:hypothetical protein
MDTASRPRASRRRPDAFLDRWATLNIEMDEDAKVHWAETVDKLLPSRFPGNPGLFGGKTKVCMNCILLTHCYLRDSLDYWENMGNLGMERTDID